MKHHEREINVALEAARRASDLIDAVYATEFSVDWKGRGDPVTEADRRANALIVEALQKAFPDDAVCAEEASAEESSEAAARGGRCWFVDPLDGTKEFVDRNGEFCVMIGLAIDGRAALGVLVAPAWRRCFAGVIGEGAWEVSADGARSPLRVRDVQEVAQARLVVSRSHRSARIDALASRLGITATRPCGSVGLKVSLVATADADVYVHLGRGPKLWDGCAPEAVARAAGASVTDARGVALRYDTRALPLDDGIVVASPQVAARVVEALAGV